MTAAVQRAQTAGDAAALLAQAESRISEERQRAIDAGRGTATRRHRRGDAGRGAPPGRSGRDKTDRGVPARRARREGPGDRDRPRKSGRGQNDGGPAAREDGGDRGRYGRRQPLSRPRRPRPPEKTLRPSSRGSATAARPRLRRAARPAGGPRARQGGARPGRGAPRQGRLGAADHFRAQLGLLAGLSLGRQLR